MRFTEEQAKKFHKGSLIEKINAKESGVRIEVIDSSTIERINERALISIRQNEIIRQKQDEIAQKTFSD